MGCKYSKCCKSDTTVLRVPTKELGSIRNSDSNNVFGKVTDAVAASTTKRLSEGEARLSEYLPRTAFEVHLRCAKQLANLDFSLVDTATAGFASLVVGKNLSDPYALLAIGEPGVAWKERQHHGPVLRSKTIDDNLNPVWDEKFTIRANEGLDKVELHIVVFDYDGSLSVDDDFLGEVRIPLDFDNDDDGPQFTKVDDLPLTGELAVREKSTISVSYRHKVLTDPGDKVTYKVTAFTWDDSDVTAATAQPVYAMFVGTLGSTPIMCLQDASAQVLVSSQATHWSFEWENIGEPLYICVQLRHTAAHHCWALAKFTMSCYGKCWTFPFYSWLYDKKPAAVIFEGMATTPAAMRKRFQRLQDHKLHDHTQTPKARKRSVLQQITEAPPVENSGRGALLREVSATYGEDAPAQVTGSAGGESKAGGSPDESAVAAEQAEGENVLVLDQYERATRIAAKEAAERAAKKAQMVAEAVAKANEETSAAAASGQAVDSADISVAAAKPEARATPEAATADRAEEAGGEAKREEAAPADTNPEVEAAAQTDAAAAAEAAEAEYKLAVERMKAHEYDEGREYNMYRTDGSGTVVDTAMVEQKEEFAEAALERRAALIEEVNHRPLDADPDERYLMQTEARIIEVKTHQREYDWAQGMYFDNDDADWRILPGQINAAGPRGKIHSLNLPVTERFANDKQSDYFWIGVRGIANCYLSKFVGKFHPFSHFDDVLNLFRNIPYPEVIEDGRWRTDEEFGRHAVQGYDPIQLQQWPAAGTPEHAAMLAKFPVGDEALGWPAGRFREKEDAKALYCIDFVELIGMRCWDDLAPKKFHHNGTRPRFCAPSICLYAVEDGVLMPVAIQLGQDPTVSPLFTPVHDTPLDWLLAKMLVQNSGANLHQIISHAMKTHLIAEPFVIAAERNIAHCHPLYKIIKRHMRYTLAINTKARNGLIDMGGIFDEFISCGGGGHIELMIGLYDKWEIHHNNLRKNLEARGVMNKEELPYYPYRDDGLLVWDAMEAFIREVVDMHYATDADMKADTEMQAFAQDVAKFGHTQKHFDPAMVDTKDGVVELFTTLMWTVSCQHSSVNFGQYKYLGFPLNAPMSVYVDPRTIKKGEYDTEGKIMKHIMPTQHQICRQVAVAYMLGA